MWVFPKRRFDIVLHTFNPCTGKILHMHLTIFQWMREFISYNMFGNAIINYHFLCLLWSVIFRRGSSVSVVTEFLQQLLSFVLFLNWCMWSQLIFFTNLISWLAIYICSYNSITIWVLTNCLFISFELFIAVLYFISIIDLNESSTSGLIDQIDIFWSFFNKNLVSTTNGGVMRVVFQIHK